mgnify:CR=1 FL=1
MKRPNRHQVIKIGVIAVIVGIILFTGRDYIFPRPMKQVLGIENAKIVKISLLDGTSGIRKTITDPRQIKEFMSLFDGAYLLKHINQAPASGFVISVALYTDQKHPDSASFNFGFLIVGTNNERYLSSRYFSDDELEEIRKKYGLKQV